GLSLQSNRPSRDRQQSVELNRFPLERAGPVATSSPPAALTFRTGRSGRERMTETWLWVGFAAIVAGVLTFDLGILGRRQRRIGLRMSLLLVGVYVLLALLFGAAIFLWRGAEAGLTYLTAYVLEESLSLDNIFLWVLIFEHLSV